MSEPTDDPGKSDLDKRVSQARQRQPAPPDDTGIGIGIAARSGVEFVAAIVVAGGIGLLADCWLHTAPVLLLVMLVLGFGAGLLNIYRMLNGMPYGATYKSRKADDEH